jgi:hypothetical protein
LFKRLPVFPDRMAISWTGIPLQSDYAYNDPDDGSLHYFGFDKALFDEIHGHFGKVMAKYRRRCRPEGVKWATAYDDITSKDYWAELIPSFEA